MKNNKQITSLSQKEWQKLLEEFKNNLTKDQARIVTLEDLLTKSFNTIEFLHGCLTNPNYKYTYPKQTQELLSEIRNNVRILESCIHSGLEDDCQICQERIKYLTKLRAAKKVLKNEKL